MISVIIPHLEQPDALSRCLSSLRSQEDLTQPFEITVVDNGSKAPPVEVCRAFPNVTLLSQPVPGPGPARNLGVLHSTGDILAFIDADCVAHRTWLAQIDRRFKESEDVCILGGDVRILHENPDKLTLLEAYESVFAYRMKEYIAKQGFTGTGNLAVRAAVFAAIGPFGGIDIAEDRDWGQRALRLGYRTHYCPEMVIYHPARKSFAELAQKWQRHTAHDFAQFHSKPGWWLRWMARSAAVALSPPAELLRIGFSDRLKGLHARRLAFLGVVMIRLYRSGLMVSLAFGGDASHRSGRWNRT